MGLIKGVSLAPAIQGPLQRGKCPEEERRTHFTSRSLKALRSGNIRGLYKVSVSDRGLNRRKHRKTCLDFKPSSSKGSQVG